MGKNHKIAGKRKYHTHVEPRYEGKHLMDVLTAGAIGFVGITHGVRRMTVASKNCSLDQNSIGCHAAYPIQSSFCNQVLYITKIGKEYSTTIK